MDGKENARRAPDLHERRRWLRFLDPVLTGEIRDAGSVSPEEVMEMAAGSLHGLASHGTIEEWWEYAHRRSWLEEHGTGRCRLTSTGRDDLRVRREYMESPDPADWGRTLMGWTLAGGAVGAAGYVTGKYSELWIAIVVICLIVAVLFFVASPIARAADRPMERWLARRACDCLDGRRGEWWRRQHPAGEGGVRRLYQDDECGMKDVQGLLADRQPG